MDFEGQHELAPNIYIDMFYDQGLSVPEAVEKIKFMLTDQRDFISEHSGDMDDGLKDMVVWTSAKERIIPILMNIDKADLDGMVYHEVPNTTTQDIVVAFRYVIENNKSGRMSIKVTQKEVDQWDINIDILFDQAVKNLSKEHPFIQGLNSLVLALIGEDDMPFPVGDFDDDMIVITNQNKVDGAVMIIHPEIALDPKWNQFVFIPSSRHEIIAVRKSTIQNPQEIEKMVADVNYSVVSDVDFLSDHPFERLLDI